MESRICVLEGLSDRVPLALLLHENSKIHAATLDQVSASIEEFASDEDQLRQSLTGVKTYPGFERLPLPDRCDLPAPGLSLQEALARRRSHRDYLNTGIPRKELAVLLDFSCGVTAQASVSLPGGSWPLHLRAAPSGGALFPIETYAVVLPTESASGAAAETPVGAYHFHPQDRCLERLPVPVSRESIASLIVTPEETLSAPLVIVLTARWKRTLTKYGERGYRLLWLEAGHIAQNFELVATALGFASCPIAGFHDDELAAALGLDSREEPVVYLLTVGFGSSGA